MEVTGYMQLITWLDPVPSEYHGLLPSFETEAIAYIWERLFEPLGIGGALSMLAFGVMDWVLYPQHLLSLWLLRFFGLILPYSAVAVIARYGRRLIHPYLLGLGLQVVLTLTVCAMLLVVGDWTSPYWLLILTAAIFAHTAPWSTGWALGGGLVTAGIYLSGSLFLSGWTRSEPGIIAFYNLALLSIIFIGLGAIHRPLRYLRWQNFLHRRQLATTQSALKTANQALQQNIAALEVNNAELDAFAHTVAHDLKNPITVLIGYSAMLEAHFGQMSPETIKEHLQRIASNSRRLARIVDELLLLAGVRKMERLQIQPLDMGRITGEARERLADMITRQQAEITAPETWPVALGYAPWVEEIWVNYISNALKYGGTPPRVELGYSLLEASNQHPATSIQFWVQDNGPGLEPEAQAQLFAEFTRLEQTRAEGHGLGLSIVRRISAKLGGEVGVESEVGRGSRFWFTLPVAAQ